MIYLQLSPYRCICAPIRSRIQLSSRDDSLVPHTHGDTHTHTHQFRLCGSCRGATAAHPEGRGPGQGVCVFVCVCLLSCITSCLLLAHNAAHCGQGSTHAHTRMHHIHARTHMCTHGKRQTTCTFKRWCAGVRWRIDEGPGSNDTHGHTRTRYVCL